jgi:hypothetical protein
MAFHLDKQQLPPQPPVYEIRLKGFLPDAWSSWFDGLVIQHDAEGNTTLTGPVVDQAALHGLLDKVRDLGLPLLAVRRMEDIDR